MIIFFNTIYEYPLLCCIPRCLLAWSEMWFGDCSSTYRGIFPYNILHVALTLMWFDGLYHNTKRSEYSTHINTDFHIVDLSVTSVVEFCWLHFSKKISRIKIFFDLTFTDVHTGRQKVPKSDFQSHFSMSKNGRIFLKKKIIEEYQSRTTTFANIIFWYIQFKK